MWGLGIAVVWLWTASAAAPPGEWEIDAPEGWHEDAAASKQSRDQVVALERELDQIKVRVWAAESRRAVLFVESAVAPFSHGKTIRAQIDAIDANVVAGFTSAAVTDRSQIVGNMVIRDLRIDSMRDTPMPAHIVRRYQAGTGGLYLLITACTGKADLAPCDAALDSVRFTVAHPLGLDERPPGDLVYRVGRAFAMVVWLGAGLGVALWLLHKPRRTRVVRTAAPAGPRQGPPAPAPPPPEPPPEPGPSVTAEAPPGSRPESGAAADDR